MSSRGSGEQTWERFEWTGFRYLQLTIRNALQPLTIHRVGLHFTSYPVETRGAFECSDALLNQIWQAGANTLQLCMHDGFVDCPQREQRQFAGDAYVEVLVNFAAFGDPYLTAKLLRQVAQQQRADGLTRTTAPGDGLVSDLTITDYCLYWLMTAREYVRYSGDPAMVAELYPGIERALIWFSHYVDADGLLNSPPHWVFVDWAEVDKRGQSTALNAQYARALEMSAELIEKAGLSGRAEALRVQAEVVKAAINRHLWDETRGGVCGRPLGRSPEPPRFAAGERFVSGLWYRLQRATGARPPVRDRSSTGEADRLHPESGDASDV